MNVLQSSHPRRRFRPLSSIGAKITAILLTLGASAAVIGFMVTVVFDRVATDMAALTSSELPQLELSGAWIGVSNTAKNAMNAALLAQTSADLDRSGEDVADLTQRFDDLVNALPAADRPLYEDASRETTQALTNLVAARVSALRNQDWITRQTADLQISSQRLQNRLSEVADSTYFDLAVGGEETISTIDNSLSDLVERDFAGLQLVLEARAEINLLSGVTLAVANLRDAATLSILNDIGTAAQGRLDALISDLAGNEAVTLDLEAVTTASEVFRQSRDGAPRRQDVLGARQVADAALASAVDDMVFMLTISAADVAENNGETIQSLLDNQIGALTQLLELNSWISAFQVAAIDVVSANDAAQVKTAATDLEKASTEITARLNIADGVLAADLQSFVSLADPETGLPAFKTASIQANADVLREAEASSLVVLAIAAQAAEMGAARRAEIGQMATGIAGDITDAQSQIYMLIGAAGGVLALALLITKLLILKPLRAISTTTERLAEGDRSPVEGFAKSSDEIYRIANALSVFRDGLVEKDAMEQHASEERDRRKAEQDTAVHAIGEGLERLSKGDLTARIDQEMTGGYAKLRDDFNQTLDTLRQAMGETVAAAASINGGANEISQATTDLSRRTENQAATLEQTAAAMEELNASVGSAADAVHNVENVVREAKNVAEANEVVVNNAVASMNEIAKSSADVSKFVAVIDDIAFQTNLLALNAGVEAARAGEAGKGFAVVAAEVRTLAQRSSESAMEIKQLIESSTHQVEEGVSLVGQAGDALHETLQRFGDISTLVSGIATTASEQATGLNEINIGMSQLDEVTQQNAAMVEQTTAASQNLDGDARQLSSLVGKFKIGDTGLAVSLPQDAALPDVSLPDTTWVTPTPANVPDAKRAAGAQPGTWAEF